MQENRPTSASITLLLAVAPPAHNKLRKLYEETFEFHVLRLIDNVPTVPDRLNADCKIGSKKCLKKKQKQKQNVMRHK